MPAPASELHGLVLRVDAKSCLVEHGGAVHKLPLQGKLFENRSHEKQPLAVGDQVQLDATGLAIAAILPRQSQLHRRASSEGEARAQVLAANISLVLVVASVSDPTFQPELVDGVLAAAARESIPTALALTKVDLEPTAAQQLAATYANAGVRLFACSTVPGHGDPDALPALGELLHQHRTVICGLSGAGKSTLVNTVVPGANLRTGSLNHIGQGRHTTAHTELVRLPGGGHLLDTPGVRNFHLFGAGSQELQFLLPELAAVRAGCSYRSCLHEREADCAVRIAVAAGQIPQSRYASYLTMLARAQEEEQPPSRSSRGQGRVGGRRRPSR